MIRSNMIYFFVLCTLHIFFILLSQALLDLDAKIYSSLTDKMNSQQIVDFFSFQDKWKWLTYVIVPVIFFLKTTLIASVLFMGAYFFSNENIMFNQFWNCVVKAEYLFLLMSLVKIIWFYFINPDYTLNDIQYFCPLSALNIIGYQGLDNWLIYPLQVLNLFELVYVISLSYQVGCLTKTDIDNGLKIVCYSYIPALLLWVTIVMFFTLNYS